jgi:hypothetical protein
MILPEGNYIGIMAQNVQMVFPNLVKEKIALGHRDPVTMQKNGTDTKFFAVNYIGLIPILVEAVNELDAKTEENAQLKAALDQTNATLSNTNATMEAMQKQIDDMCSNGCYGLNGANTSSNQSGNASNKLLQNVPNPFSNSTTIG